MDVVKEEVTTSATARKILEAIAKEKELGYEQNNALEYLKKFSKISERRSKELIEALGKVSKLKDRHKAMIIDFMPADMDDLRILFAHEIITLSEDDKKEILKVVKKFS